MHHLLLSWPNSFWVIVMKVHFCCWMAAAVQCTQNNTIKSQWHLRYECNWETPRALTCTKNFVAVFWRWHLGTERCTAWASRVTQITEMHAETCEPMNASFTSEHTSADTCSLKKIMGDWTFSFIVTAAITLAFQCAKTAQGQGEKQIHKRVLLHTHTHLHPLLPHPTHTYIHMHTKSKQVHTWYQRARLQGDCVWLPCQVESVRGGRSCVCVCWWMQTAWWGTAGSAAAGPVGRRNRDTGGQSHSSAAHSSLDLRSLSIHLKEEENNKIQCIWPVTHWELWHVNRKLLINYERYCKAHYGSSVGNYCVLML